LMLLLLLLLVLLLLLLLFWVRDPLLYLRNLGLERGASPKLLGCGMNADPNPLGLADPPDPRLYVLRKDPILMGPVLRPKSLGSLVRTQMPWVLQPRLTQDYRSCVMTQS
jgi:hypothetical protein